MATTARVTNKENQHDDLTIDTEVHPPRILLVRGRAELDFTDGIPAEYLQFSGTYQMTAEQRVEWVANLPQQSTRFIERLDQARQRAGHRGRGISLPSPWRTTALSRS